MGELAVAVSGVTKRYGDFVAVDALSLAVPRGVVYGVLGPNGAGKTTTLRMINDILAPDAGEIRLFGALAPGREAGRRIGYLPEERGLYPKMRVVELLAFFARLRHVPRRDALIRADRWLDRLELSAWRKHAVQDLSKGMQQKVQFAAALIHEPELLILDEPWSGLDPINADVLRDIVLEQRAAGRTILFSTHQMAQAEQICDEVCIIARGKKVLDGPLDQLRRAAAADRLVALELATPADLAAVEAGPLADPALVTAVRPRRGHVEVELASDAAAGTLLARLVALGVGVRRFELVVPTLHQIFVDRVGAEVAAGREGAPDA
ncbi:MAG: ATP-binding cassette domain-containing protein [Deltaproteobacteria bacterium]|nr:MAG: ATP-binding cassette domain-containing protein [Deltaproteobacteria bacterium]